MVEVRLRNVLHKLREIRVELVAREESFRPCLVSLLLVGQEADSVSLCPPIVTSEDEHRPRVLTEEARKV